MKWARRAFRLRFSLRLLMVLFTIAAILLAIGGRKVYQARKQRALSSLILSYGGEPHHELQFTNGTERGIRFPNMEFSPAMPGPDWLRRRIGDEYFVEIVEAYFDKTSHRVLDDPGLAEFVAQVEARSLPMPRGLVFYDLPITDAGVRELSIFPHLTSLHISKSPGVTDEALKHIGKLRRLRRLRLKDCSITDRGLVHLSGLTELRELSLSGASVTDAGLEHLHTLKNLEWLRLSGTQVTLDGVKSLREALPDCQCAR